ncbi:MAG: hypothetical protein D6822_08835 [Cyanobacteria bacterium J149]|nr:MAG: hypothetical protein D6822_08835 [Cyanobacteria bacterium J149]
MVNISAIIFLVGILSSTSNTVLIRIKIYLVKRVLVKKVKGKGQRTKGKGQRTKGKGQRTKGKPPFIPPREGGGQR